MTTIFQEAEQLINGDRKEDYGPVEESFLRIASIWTGILGRPVSPEQVALCMIGLKVYRESVHHKRDNRVDIAGYTALLDKLCQE